MSQKRQAVDSISEIYKFGKSLQRAMDVIKKELSPENQKLVFEFFKAC